MKYLKALIYFFMPLLVILLISSTLNYYDIIPNNVVKYVNLINILLSTLSCGMFIGRCSESKGYKEGIKVGLLIFTILFTFNYLALDKGFNLIRIVFYIIIIIACIIGSVIGINRKKI
jgi:putative membrane protein, TIGR04086 family/integral membrane protein, TIGR04097 family